jgi:ApaG protein
MIANTRDHRQAGVARERGVRPGAAAEVEPRAAIAGDDAGVLARHAQADAPLLRIWLVHGLWHHCSMFTSDAVTRGIKVHVESEYAPERSQPSQNQWFFLYTITITNESAETAQLLTRHWVITDGTGHIEEVHGPGVVGKQPTLAPGESFTYTSGCPLTTPFGVMEGTYQMVTGNGEEFDARIAPFTLSEPYTVH